MQVVDNKGNFISQHDDSKISSVISSSSDQEDSVLGNDDEKLPATATKKKKQIVGVGTDQVMGKLNKAARFIKLHPSAALSNGSKAKSKKWKTKLLPTKKARVSAKHDNNVLKKSMQRSVNEGDIRIDICAEAYITKELEEVEQKLVTATKTTARIWQQFKKIIPFYHKQYPHHEMCLICIKSG